MELNELREQALKEYKKQKKEAGRTWENLIGVQSGWLYATQ
jgi:hypothetical protein